MMKLSPGSIAAVLLGFASGAGLDLVVARSALAADRVASDEMPRDPRAHRSPDLVELTWLEPGIKLDIRYARPDNFLGKAVYEEARAFLQRPAALALVRVHRALEARGYGLLVFDGYRPWSITKAFYEATPAGKKQFVASPKSGSRHNRGCAVDLSLYDLKTGRAVGMPSDYDEFSERAATGYTGGSIEARRLRDLLRRAMVKEGFTGIRSEWWHFDYKGWQSWPILDIPFSQIDATEKAP